MAAGPLPAAPADSAPPEPAESTALADLVLQIDVLKYLPEELHGLWTSLQHYPLLFAPLLVVLGYLIGWVLKSILHRLVEGFIKSKASELDYQIAHYLTKPVLQTTVMLSVILALLVFDLPHSVESVINRILFTVLLVLWGRAWFRATTAILKSLESNRERFHVFQPRTVPLFEMCIKVMLLGLFVYLLFLIWGVNATAWIASAGVIGIVVGFAARDTLANLISGISIVADAPYKLGDYVVLDTGERGIVTHLGIRSTRLLTRDDVEISIPNAVIGAAKITNESGGPWVKHRIRVPVGVAYGSDTEKVVACLETIAVENTNVVQDPSPRVRMRAFGESSLNFELLCWISLPEQRGQVVHQLLMEIDKRFRTENIVIPFPQRDLHVNRMARPVTPQAVNHSTADTSNESTGEDQVEAGNKS